MFFYAINILQQLKVKHVTLMYDRRDFPTNLECVIVIEEAITMTGIRKMF